MASIKKIGPNNWGVQYRTPENKVTRRRGFATKKEAEDFAATVAVAKLRGEYIDPQAAQVTVGELGVQWLARRTHLKPSSARTEKVAWRVHVEPRWGHVKLAEIRHSTVKQWVAEMSREKRRDGKVIKKASGPVTVIRAYGVLAGILDEAVADRRMLTNPARGVKLPRKVRRDHAYLTDAQVLDLADAAATGRGGDDKAVIVMVLAYCGLRWGELAGLHVADVDTMRRRINVRRNAVNVGGTVEVGTPKTHERRTVPMPRFVADLVAEVCRGKGRGEILFPAAGGGYAKSPGINTWFDGAVSRCITAAAEARKDEAKGGGDPVTPEFPRVTPHDLRHTAASLAVSAGANVKAVQKMLGHASAAMTLDTYADLFDRDADAVADAHDARLAGLIAEKNAAKMQPRGSFSAI